MKNNLLSILSLIGIIAMIVGGITMVIHRNNRMDAYAKANDCTWYATGSMYGDDRDFICK